MDYFIDALNRTAEAWWTYVFHATWQAAVVGMLVMAVVALVRRRPAPLRYWLLVLALAKFAIPPLLAFPVGVFGLMGPVDSHNAVDVMDINVPAGVVEESVFADHVSPARDIIPASQPAGPIVETPFAWSEQAASKDAASVHGETDAQQAARPLVTSPPATSPPIISPSATDAVASAAVSLDFKTCLMLAHIAGSLAVFGCVAFQFARLRHSMRRAQHVSEGPLLESFVSICRRMELRRLPRMLLAKEGHTPYSFGILRPAVVVPGTLVEQLSDEELATVFAHEAAHHARGDLWLNWLQVVLCVVWWFNPVVWLVGRGLRAVREDCCDDLLLWHEGLISADAYCTALLRVASRPERSIAIPCGLCMADSRRRLARRFKRIMDGRAKRSKGLSWRGGLVIVLLGFLLLPGLRESVADEETTEAAKVKKTQKSAVEKNELKESDAPNTTEGKQGICTFTGKILNEDGKPVEGADVWICRSFDRATPFLKNVAHAKTDSLGRYSIEVPIQKLGTLQWRNWLLLLVYKSGWCPVSSGVSPQFTKRYMRWLSRDYSTDFLAQLAGEVFANEKPLVLRPTTTVSINIVGPDKNPVSDAKVITLPIAGCGIESWDDDLRQYFEKDLSSTTDADGKATLQVDPQDESLGILVMSHRYGRQNFRWRNQSTPQTINLQPTGSLVGRLVADDPKIVAGQKLRISTHMSNRDMYGRATPNGSDMVVTDDKGRFRVPAIMEGSLRIHANAFEPFGSHYRAIIPDGICINAGQTTDIQIPLKKATEVCGRVVEKNSGKPVAGVKIKVQQEEFNKRGIYNSKTIITDASGRYRIFLLPGPATFTSRLTQSYTSGGMYRPKSFFKHLTIPEGRSTFELPLIEIIQGVTLRGRVLDESGKPVTNVRVFATPKLQNGSDVKAPYSVPCAISDEKGNFALEDIDPSLTSSVAAKTSTLISEPQMVKADSNKFIEILIPKENFVSLSGRVVDGNGKPAAGVKYNVLVSKLHYLKSETACKGVTDREGKLKTPKIFLMGKSYLLEVLVNGIVVANSRGIAPKADDNQTFGDVVLRWPLPDGQKPRIVVYKRLAGRVVDRHGQPVPEAKITVWHGGLRLHTSGDREGRFNAPKVDHVRGVPVNGAFVFVEAEGFRFHGDLIQPGDETVTVVLTRTSEIPNMRAQGAAAKRTSEQVLAAVRKWEKSDAARSGSEKDAVSPTPNDTRAELMKKYREQMQACCRTAAADPARARRMAESIDDGSLRAYALGLMAGELCESDRSGAKKMLDEAYAILEKIAEREAAGSPNSWSPVTIGAALLPAVERVDPELVPEYLWRALSCRTNMKVGGGSLDILGRRNGRLALADPLLAILLADYDGDLARRIFVPPDDQSVVTRGGRFPRHFFAAAAVLDPQAGLKSLGAIPQSTEEMKVQKRQAWRDFVAMLKSDSHERRAWVLEKLRLCDYERPDSKP